MIFRPIIASITGALATMEAEETASAEDREIIVSVPGIPIDELRSIKESGGGPG